MKIYRYLLTIMLIPLFLVTNAQNKKSEMPEDQARLQKFTGKWQADLSMTDENNKASKVRSVVTFNTIADGHGIYGTEVADDPVNGKLNASYMMGYDPYQKKIHFFAVDNQGVCHDHECYWKSADSFHAEHNSDRDGKAYKEVIDINFKDANNLELVVTATLGGKSLGTVKGMYTKSMASK